MQTQLSSLHSAKPAWLVLESGHTYHGFSIGCEGTTYGELVFNTAMTGYQEILTDPSYKGQVVLMTYPEIGNYGVNTEDFESNGLHAAGFIVRRLSPSTSSCRAGGSLATWLKQLGVIGIEGIDTRAITRLVRAKGALKCGITTDADLLPRFLEQINAQPSLDDQPLVSQVTTPQRYQYCAKPVVAGLLGDAHRLKKLVALDFGIKTNILRCLAPLVAELVVLPAFASFEDIMAEKPEAVFLSNGPGDPRSLPSVIETVQRLLANNVPTFGICLGHQLLALAMGLSVEKMPFGHHGGNHPVKDIELNTITITSQNHGYCVQYPDAASALGQAITVTHINLNDQTIEGIRHNHLPAFSVQFHPEAAPGPQDSVYLFERFLQHCQQVNRGGKQPNVAATFVSC
jgi:carbamoyl-phosphate synthase small subunit